VKIHPTAIVDPGAQIGNEVEIGPYSLVGAQVIIGEKCVVQSHVVIEGATRMGAENFIGHGTVIGAAPQDLSFKPQTKSRIEIGNGNTLREYCTIHRGAAEGSTTTIGDANYLMVGTHVGHNCAVGKNVIIANNCLLGGHVQVGDGAFLGGGCVFHQFIRVGRLAITQGGSAFSKDVPPFTIAALLNYVFGLNVVGLRRAGFSAKDRDEIKAAFKLIYSSGLNTRQALEKAKTMKLGAAAGEFFEFVASAQKRGICALRQGGDENMSI
jgi:UDP-N-acetylglucosamine acyltransferase